MHLTYQKLGKDHPMFGRVEYLVVDELQPICYKTKNGYLPLENSSPAAASEAAKADVETRPLYIISFKVNDEAEEMTFTSKKKHGKTLEKLKTKPFVSDIKTTTYQVLA